MNIDRIWKAFEEWVSTKWIQKRFKYQLNDLANIQASLPLNTQNNYGREARLL